MKPSPETPLRLRFLDENNEPYPEWEEKKLGDAVSDNLIKIGRGKVISKTDIKLDPGEYPIYSSSALNNGKMGSYNKYAFDDELISWSIDGGGKFFYRPKHKFSLTNVSGWAKVESPLMLTKFLFASLSQQWERLHFDYSLKAHPSVIQNLYTIPLPSLPEQEKIGEFLSALDIEIEQAERLVSLLSDRKRAYTQGIFNRTLRFLDEDGNPYSEWEEKKLGEVSEIVTGTTPSKANASYWNSPDILWVSPSDLDKQRIVSNSQNMVSEKARQILRILPQGSILLTCIGSSIGKIGVLGREGSSNQQINALISNEKSRSDFLYQALKSQVKSIVNLSGKSVVPIINKTDLSGLFIPLPSLPEQEKIGSFLSALDDEIDEAKRELELLKERKRAYAQRIFGV